MSVVASIQEQRGGLLSKSTATSEMAAKNGGSSAATRQLGQLHIIQAFADWKQELTIKRRGSATWQN